MYGGSITRLLAYGPSELLDHYQHRNDRLQHDPSNRQAEEAYNIQSEKELVTLE